MKNEKNSYKNFKPHSLTNLKIKKSKYSLESRNKNNIYNDKEYYTLNEKEHNQKDKLINLFSNDIHLKTDFRIPKLSSQKYIYDNLNIKKSKENKLKNDAIYDNSKTENFLDESKNNKIDMSILLTTNNINLKKYNRNIIHSLDVNKNKIYNSDYNLNEQNNEHNLLNNDNNNIESHKILYPFLNHKKNTKLENKSKIKNKFPFKINLNNVNKIYNSLFDKKEINNINDIIDLNSFDNKNKTNINFKNKLFPTSINELNKYGTHSTSEQKYEKNKYNRTLNNFYFNNKKKFKNSKIKLEKKHNDNNINIKKNNITSKFKEYQNQLEFSFSNIKKSANTLSKDIITNPFMRKIVNLKEINQFEIVFHKAILDNIIEVQQKTKSGFFKGECGGINTNKNKPNGNYICENRANIFNISEMIDRMHPISCLKFNEILRNDYKEFLGYKNNLKKKKSKKEDELRKRLIKKYHKELFFENEIADKYDIKKNPNIKFIHDDEEEAKKKENDF